MWIELSKGGEGKWLSDFLLDGGILLNFGMESKCYGVV